MPVRLTGIYLITNVQNQEMYVGQAVDIYARWTMHRADLSRARHGLWTEASAKLKAAAKAFPESAFRFSIIELCQPDQLNEREIHWIYQLRPQLNSKVPDYNAPLAGASLRQDWDVEAIRRKLREAEDNVPRCRCGHFRQPPDRYCKRCQKKVVRELARVGYLEPYPVPTTRTRRLAVELRMAAMDDYTADYS